MSDTTMAQTSFSRAGLALAAGLLALATTPIAFAQDSFQGNWTVVEVTKPDGTERTDHPQDKPMAIGDTVAFGPSQVDASGSMACADPSYQIVNVKQGELFDKSISGLAESASVAKRFGLETNPRSLKVDCNNGTMFEFHEARNGRIVTLFDSLVYTLERPR